MSARAGSSSGPRMTTELDGFPVIDLRSEAGGLEASVVPGAGMVVCSLRHHGDELLGQRRGLRAYVEERATMGIPLLYPWANRVASALRRRRSQGRSRPGLAARRDAIRGPSDARSARAARGWRVDRHGRRRAVSRELRLRRPGRPDRGVPVPARVLYEATLEGSTLSITTTVEATRGTPVPIAFGYHPYFRLPGIARGDWEVEVPVRERLRAGPADAADGRARAGEIAPGPLGARTFDDALLAPPTGAPFVARGPRPPHRGAFERGLSDSPRSTRPPTTT